MNLLRHLLNHQVTHSSDYQQNAILATAKRHRKFTATINRNKL